MVPDNLKKLAEESIQNNKKSTSVASLNKVSQSVAKSN
jgi:hypothetical protein